MIIGECPYCDQTNMTICAPECPTFSKRICDGCGKEYWLRHSRIDPKSYTAEDFEKIYRINEETKTLEKIKEAEL